VPWGTEPVSIELCWSAAADFDLRVFDTATHQEIGCSLTQPRAGRRCAVVQFDPNGGRTYQVRVRQTRGNPSTFHLVALGGSLRHATPKCSIPFPGDGPEVIAVGAVDAVGHRVAYSSCGPIASRLKPDLVASVPFPSLWRPRPFSGTSAAAPQA